MTCGLATFGTCVRAGGTLLTFDRLLRKIESDACCVWVPLTVNMIAIRYVD